MEFLTDILQEILEDVFSFLITSPRIPKPIRYLLVAVLAGFILALGILLVIRGEGLAGSIFGCVLAVLAIAAGVYLARKIYRS